MRWRAEPLLELGERDVREQRAALEPLPAAWLCSLQAGGSGARRNVFFIPLKRELTSARPPWPAPPLDVGPADRQRAPRLPTAPPSCEHPH